jgi:bifunctional ADP-heptose synthase (sugar kinase/adenylyltransferase)
MGHQVALFGVVGPDWAAAQLQHLLGRITHFCKPLLPATIVKLRAHAQSRLIARVDCERTVPVAYPVQAAGEEGENNGLPDAVIFSDYSKGIFGGHTRDAVRRIIAWGCPTIVDPRPFDYVQIWAEATVATPNLREFQQLDIGTDYIVVTRGEKGAVVYDQGQSREIPAQAVENAQIIGAGDALTCGLAAALAEGRNIHQAAEFAVSYAGEYVAQPRDALY